MSVDGSPLTVVPDSYTLHHVAAGWDADKYVETNTFVMHPTALNDIALGDGLPGHPRKAIRLPKTGYYLLWVANVLEAKSWHLGPHGPVIDGPQYGDPGFFDNDIVGTITPEESAAPP